MQPEHVAVDILYNIYVVLTDYLLVLSNKNTREIRLIEATLS
jgi:hypothetical protein